MALGRAAGLLAASALLSVVRFTQGNVIGIDLGVDFMKVHIGDSVPCGFVEISSAIIPCFIAADLVVSVLSCANSVVGLARRVKELLSTVPCHGCTLPFQRPSSQYQ